MGYFGRRLRNVYPVQFLHLLPDVALSQRDIDHRRLDVGVAHGLHDGEWVGTRHGMSGVKKK